MDERYTGTDNESTCIICNSLDLKYVSGHTLLCNACGAMWCESCTD